MRAIVMVALALGLCGCSLIVTGPGDLRPTAGDGGQGADGGEDRTDAGHDTGRDAGRDAGVDGGVDGGPTCEAPLELCGGACVDTESDLMNCGSCGNACAATDRCNAGTCYDPVVEVAAGLGYSCARRASGQVWCWGYNGQSTLGDGTNLGRVTPVRALNVEGADQVVTGVILGGFAAMFSCARVAGGSVRCWGSNGRGQLGDGTTTARGIAVDVLGLGPVISVGVGGVGPSCAVSTDHQLYCWGGLDSLGAPLPPSSLAPPGITGSWAAEVTMTANIGCVLSTDGQVYCWGNNASGQLGDGRTTTDLGAAVPGISGPRALAVSTLAACAILGDGSVSCWGRADALGAGLGTMDPHPEPVMVPGLADVTALDGFAHTCAIHGTDRRVSCWGDTPVEVDGLTGAVDVAVGLDHYCAALEDGSVMCWGSNTYGQLGDGTTDDRTVPTPVVGLP